MKIIETASTKEASVDFHNKFYEWVPDLVALGESRGITLTVMHLFGLLCKTIDLMNLSIFSHLQKTGYKALFVRVTFEETENRSAKFTIILLDEQKKPLSQEEIYPVVYFLATKEDIQNAPHGIKEICELPDKEPSRN